MAAGGFTRFAYTYLAKLLLKCNRAARYPSSGAVDLTTARTDAALSITGLALTVVDKGTGTWSMKLKFADDTTCEFTSTEISAGDSWEIQFSDLLLTNAAQAAVTGPKFYYAWRS